jgi:hypothetical protein
LTTITTATALSATVYAPQKYYPENLTNGALASGTSWTAAGDFASSGGKAVYTHSTAAGTYTQAVTALARTGKSGCRYDFTYTVSSPANTAPTIVISTDFADVATALTGLGTAGTYTVRLTATTTPGAFVLTGSSGAAGAVSLDDLSLLRVVEEEGKRQVKRAVITVETAAINFCVDGSTPTLTSGTHQGHLLQVGDVLTLNDITEIIMFRCINAVASSGSVVKVTYSFA